ncbi:entericidin A/B family lipoprotein [Allochromatium palmeri]|uniref:Entericidin A/B family lipoprotein n=1 Tax=Allochromatium palmeri TaxID=231048 RepID=A0A6N8E9U2_9GAMM|nr:entericidin A/B family lipoprotein [Allochromatium palmeri]MTW21062.1 entericidin A/B family lipoprotein [Allochromatium palmeri]
MRHSITQSIWQLLLLFALMSVLAGCNTMAGVGEDLEAAGDGIEKSAKREKDY